MLILEQSVIFISYLEIGSSKNREIYMRETRLTYLSSPTGITLLSVRVPEIGPF
jgi:hypothetical protein